MPLKVGVFLFLAIPIFADPVYTVYRDVGQWTAAASTAPNTQLERSSFLDNGQATAPDLSLLDFSYNGITSIWRFSNGRANLITTAHDTPVLEFADPTYAFAATFTYGVVGGVGIFITNPGGWPPPITVESNDASFVNGFFGFTSTVPFYALYFEPALDDGIFGQEFFMSDVMFQADSPAPEPATIGLMLAAFACVAFVKKLR